MTEDQERRLSAVEQAVSDIKVRQAHIESMLSQNTAVTDAVKRDTAEIVELIKGASVLGRLAKWVAAIVGGYLAGKGLKWW
jgi:hypothetical protein